MDMQVTRSSTDTGIDTATGPSDWFTGDVYIDVVAAAPAPARTAANLVHFTPGARTVWRRHPLGLSTKTTPQCTWGEHVTDAEYNAAPAEK
jgi:quercetin dioxygenase-like cupin family protein